MPKQTLYKVMKLTTDKIYRNIDKIDATVNGVSKKIPATPHEFNLGKITYIKALKNKQIVDIGDNLLFYKIREYHGNIKTPDEIYNELKNINEQIANIKLLASSKDNVKDIKQLNQKKLDIQYVTDIINVKVTNINHYNEIALRGFSINGKKYKRFCSGSGQMRRNTVTFIDEKLYDTMYKTLMCGLDDEKVDENGNNTKRLEKIILAKLSAYFALSFSSVLWVRTPRICVIPDVNIVLKNQNIDFIKKNPDGTKEVEPKNMDIEMNSCDGEGLISPECAEWFSKDMGLDYTACQFIVRTAFIKGCLLTFDFKKYFHEVLKVEKIESIYGEIFNIDDIDVLLTESMFKMHLYYESVGEYVKFHTQYGLKWGVSRYNKKKDDDYSLLNYQYLQNNNLDDESIDDILFTTIDWFKKICSGDNFYSVMYSIGCQHEDDNNDDIINNCGSLHTKAIAQNSKMLQDGFVKKKIYESIKESFKQAKIGRLYCHSNYQFMLSDPIPLLQNAVKKEIKGEIPANHVYSNYWNKYNPTEIDLCRSPMVDRHEHNISKLYNSKNTIDWYSYLYSGIVYSIYDISTIRHSDSDFDGDIVYSTDNIQLIKGAYRNNNPITYEKEKAEEKLIKYENIVACDLNGFNTLVGKITNNSTSMNAMLPLFPEDKYPDQHNELLKRLKLLREIIGAEIDKIKLGVAPEFPKEWIERVEIKEDDSDEIKAEKYKQNSMVICKKPYFMIYLYTSLFNSYKNHIKQFDFDCRNKYRKNLLELKYTKDKDEEQVKFIKRADYFSPVLDTPCAMNKICHKIEKLENDVSFNKDFYTSVLPEFNKRLHTINKDKLNLIDGIYKEYKARRKFSYVKELMNDTLQKDEFAEYINTITKALIYEYKNRCINDISSETVEIYEYFMELAKQYNLKNKQFDYSIVWDILDTDILTVIPKENSIIYIESPDGKEYLGKKYKVLEEIK
jgi:hypothetical protein